MMSSSSKLILCFCAVLNVALAADVLREIENIVDGVNVQVEELVPNEIEHRITPLQLKTFLKAFLEVEKKRAFLKLKNYDFGCSTEVATEIKTSYRFTTYESCIWRDAKDLPGVQKFTDFNDDEIIPVIIDLSFPFFGEHTENPEILTISANGLVTVGYQSDATASTPNLDADATPYNVITSVWSAMTQGSGSASIYYGKFRMGLKIECRVVQWSDFRAATSDDPIDIQLDICSNGEFTVRILVAENVDVSDVGVKSLGVGESLGERAQGFDYTSNSAILISPN